jgi:hypothetical protein
MRGEKKKKKFWCWKLKKFSSYFFGMEENEFCLEISSKICFTGATDCRVSGQFRFFFAGTEFSSIRGIKTKESGSLQIILYFFLKKKKNSFDSKN